MRCVDVNVLVYAHREESPSHRDYLAWLNEARVGPEPLGVADLVLSGFLRVVTHPRVFREPTPLSAAVTFVSALRTSPAVVPLAPGVRHWSLFVDLCRRGRATGNLVPDAFLAALAVEHGATLCTADRGFGRFPHLRWEDPLER
ncbi:MAG: type II toxin-antitoxin system VapC family toxin [Streptomycetales bacterium]